MFWKKKKSVNEMSVGALYLQVVTFSYDIHDKALEVDKDNDYLKDKEEALYFHIVAASAMTGIMDLNDKHYSDYYQEIMIRLNKKFIRVPKLAEEFNEIVRNNYRVDENGEGNLGELISHWLYYNVSGNNEDTLAEEFYPYAVSANIIFNAYDKWFKKNAMPLN